MPLYELDFSMCHSLSLNNTASCYFSLRRENGKMLAYIWRSQIQKCYPFHMKLFQERYVLVNNTKQPHLQYLIPSYFPLLPSRSVSHQFRKRHPHSSFPAQYAPEPQFHGDSHVLRCEAVLANGVVGCSRLEIHRDRIRLEH